MKNIIKSKAWDIQISLKHNCILYQFSRTLKVADLSNNTIKSSRNVSVDYYTSLTIVETNAVIVAACAKKNQIDILSLNDLTLIQSMRGNVPRGFRREYCVIDKDEKNIYYILYRDGQQKSIVTKFSIETGKEDIIGEFPKTFLFDIKYVKKKKTCLLCGIQFYEKMTKEEIVGEYEVFWMDDFENRILLKNLVQSSYAHLNKIGLSKEQEILLFYTTKGRELIYNLKTNEEIVKLSLDSKVAFSTDDKYIACIEQRKFKSIINLYSIMEDKIIDKYVLEHKMHDWVHHVGFRANDRCLVLRMDEDIYVMELESK